MSGKRPSETHNFHPRHDKEWVDEGRHVQHHGIKRHCRHALHWVGVKNVGTDCCITHLNTRPDCGTTVSYHHQQGNKTLTQCQGDLADDPGVVLVYTDPPDNHANSSEYGGWI